MLNPDIQSASEMSPIREFFDTTGSQLVAERRRGKKHPTKEHYKKFCKTIKLSHPGVLKRRRIKVDHYRPTSQGMATEDERRPVVFVLPQLFGTLFIERALARGLAAKGMHAVILNPAESCFKSVETVEAARARLQRDIMDLVVIVRHYANRADIDPDRMGLFGASMGGLRGAMAASVLDEINAVCLIEPTVHIASTFAKAKQWIVERQRNKFKKQLGIEDDEELEQRLREELLPFLPEDLYKHGTENRSWLVMINNEDEVIEPEHQRELARKASGYSIKTQVVEGNHAAPVLRLTNPESKEHQRVVNFFKSFWSGGGTGAMASMLRLGSESF